MLPQGSLSDSFPSIPGQPEINDFCHAARDGDVPTVLRFLDQYGAEIVNRRDDIEARAITWAAFSGHTEIVELLLDRGADIDAGGTRDKTALSWAVESGRAETTALLLERGAGINVRDRDGSTPLDIARRSSSNGAAEQVEQWVETQRQRAAEAAETAARREEAAARDLTRERLRKLKEGAPGLSPLKKKPQPKK